MQVNVSTRHGNLSTETQEKIAAKVEKLTRFHDRLTAAQVTVNLEHRDAPELEIRISAERAEDFVANNRTGNLMACLDAAVRKLEQQLRKHREKTTDHRNPGRRLNSEIAEKQD